MLEKLLELAWLTDTAHLCNKTKNNIVTVGIICVVINIPERHKVVCQALKHHTTYTIILFTIPNIPCNNYHVWFEHSFCEWILNHLHACHTELNNFLENNIILLIINHFNYFMVNPYLPRTMFSWKSSLTMLPIFDVLTYNNNKKIQNQLSLSNNPQN